MGVEIDMLKVGDADAIALRYVYPTGADFVAVVDGGYKENGEELATIIRTHYHRSHIDLMISTHPDQDHISGLTALLDLVTVNRVWVHDPSKHPSSASLTTNRLKALVRSTGVAVMKSLDNLEEFTKKVDQKGILRDEPFAGLQCGPLFVVGPSVSFYEQMLLEISVDEGFVKSVSLAQVQEEHSEAYLEQYPEYAIDENDETAPSNNTSTIIWLKDADRTYLFTGDAGVQALDNARQHYNFTSLHWLQIPHHGSRRNLNSELVKYTSPKVAYVSAEGNIKHPSRAVVNALKRVNTTVYSTHKAGNLLHHMGNGVGPRAGYVAAEPL